jgi:uncharacterized protein
MTRFLTRLTLVIALLALTGVHSAPLQAQSAGGLAAFDKAELTIETAAGGRHDFEVEIAETGNQRAQGLMFRRQMAADAGMLFLFGGSAERAMWMKNTLIPLDMLFIDEKGKIVRIEQRTVPHSLRAILSGQPVSAVLELNAGTTARLVIEPGDRVLHPAFDN